MQRLQVIVLTAILFVYLLFAPNYAWKETETGTAYGADFMQEWVGARMFVTGHVSELYHPETFKAWQYDRSIMGFEWKTDQYFPPVYPPPHYALFSPFGLLPYRWAVVVWLTLLMTAAFFSAKLISDLVNHAFATSEGKDGVNHDVIDRIAHRSNFIWIGLILFPMFLFSVTLGQKSICWLLLICATWRLLQCHRDFAAGMVFGILSIKPTLFFLIPLIMLRNGNWRFFLGASSSVVLLWGSTACVVPLETWSEFAKVLSSAGNYAENIGYRIEWSCNLMTLAYSLPAELTEWGKWAICIPLSIYLLYCVFEDRHYTISSPEKAFMAIGTTLLISPHTYQYDLCILLLPILYLCVSQPKRGMATFGILVLAVTMAEDVQRSVHLPIVPITLLAMICELRLRAILKCETTQVKLSPVVA